MSSSLCSSQSIIYTEEKSSNSRSSESVISEATEVGEIASLLATKDFGEADKSNEKTTMESSTGSSQSVHNGETKRSTRDYGRIGMETTAALECVPANPRSESDGSTVKTPMERTAGSCQISMDIEKKIDSTRIKTQEAVEYNPLIGTEDSSNVDESTENYLFKCVSIVTNAPARVKFILLIALIGVFFALIGVFFAGFAVGIKSAPSTVQKQDLNTLDVNMTRYLHDFNVTKYRQLVPRYVTRHPQDENKAFGELITDERFDCIDGKKYVTVKKCSKTFKMGSLNYGCHNRGVTHNTTFLAENIRNCGGGNPEHYEKEYENDVICECELKMIGTVDEVKLGN